MALKKAPRGYWPSDPAERIATALESIGKSLHQIAKRQNATTLTQAELDELYRSATSSSTASDALQARLRQAIGKPTG